MRVAVPLKRAKNQLSLERLEAREVMAAGVTAAFSGGTLSVYDTAGDDRIVFHRKANVITIEGVSGAFSAAQVQGIVVNTTLGNDTVKLNPQSFAGEQRLGVAVEVRATAGNDQVRGLEGYDVYFNGAHSLVYDGRNPPRMDGAAFDWFDCNVRDAALRSLAKTNFRDGVLNRTDIVGMLRLVERAGTITAPVLNDLQSIARTSALFGTLNYVQVLTSDIVLGGKANAKYQGRALGNLAAGSSAAHLENLVQKWFYGADHPLGQSAWGPTYAYRQASGSLFGSGVAYTDVTQGGVGDCYFLAGLAETAVKNPAAIQSMFIVNGDGTYTVRFYNNGKADYVTVDSQLPTDSAGRFVFANNGASASNSQNKLWVALAEKAYVQMNEKGWLRSGYLPGGGQNSYIAIQGGYISDALRQITGGSVQAFISTAGGASFQSFVAAVSAGKSIGFGSNGNPTNSKVVGGHAYAVVSYNAVAKTVTLFNPWGVKSPSSKPALITLTWSQIQANFSYYDRTA